MADNSDNDKQNDKQLKSDNDIEIADKDNHHLNNTEDTKDIEEDSQDIKSSDLAIPIPSPESESEKRCTSASNAGESEYESADDEELKRMDSFEDTTTDQQKESTNKSNDDKCVDSSVESEEKITAETNDSNETDVSKVENNPNNDKIDSEIDNQKFEITSEENNSSKVENNDNSSEKSEISEQMSKNENIDNQEIENKETDFKESNDKSEDINKENEENINEMNENFIDSEGGLEEIADIDDEYEDIDESEECSVESGDNEELVDGENEDIDAEERQQGDGEESNDSQSNQKDKSLDHDEDKRNPQYIPKRGPFYEHDDRAMAATEGEVLATESVAPKTEETPPKVLVIAKKPIENDSNKKKIKKKVWIEGDKWGHDMFREEDQTPKSRDELVNTYGYDIRNEDNPPKARRKRRYARGPIKYTRQWQDENAYGRGRSPPPGDRPERKDRKDVIPNNRNERSAPRSDTNESIPKERSGSERPANEPKHRDERKEFDRRDSYERTDSYERKERIDRKERSDRRDRHRIHDKNERTNPSEKTNEFSHKKERFRNERPLNENRKYDYEESIDRRDKPFSTDDFPELPNNDLRKKLNSSQSGAQQEVWKPSHRFVNESDDQIKSDYKTEPMKIIEALEHNNRTVAHNESNSSNVVRTLTFENSKYSQRRSSGNYDYEEDRTGRTRSRKNIEVVDNSGSGRPIRKTNNNLNYQNFSHERKETNDNYRNNRNNVRTDRTERSFHSEEQSNRNVERYYEDDYKNQRESNYIIETNVGLQKISIEDKSQVINRANESEQTRPKRYSSLRQQQRIIPENIANIGSNTQISQTSDNHNINAHQFYDSHTIQTTAYYAETSSPRTTFHPFISPNATDAGPQTHPSTYMQQPIPQPIPQPLQQRYIPQPTPVSGAGDTTRYIPTSVPPNVVTAPVPTPQMAQPMPQTVPVPPPPQPVITAPPPGTTYIPSFPSGYPQFPPAPPPTHVPPGYPGHVTAQQPSPHQLAELYRGGVTYYDTQSQQQNAVRQIPQRRPKAAIPIVPPPDPHSGEGDGDKSYVSVNS